MDGYICKTKEFSLLYDNKSIKNYSQKTDYYCLKFFVSLYKDIRGT